MVDYVVRTTANPSVNDATGNNEAIFYKLERLGFRVGQKLAEKYTTDHARFNDQLDCVKFICKDFWQSLYKKQVDNLRTNHRGVYVLHDSKFKPLTHVSLESSLPIPAKEAASLYVMFPCGLIRGALQALGVPCQVTADIPTLPSTTFTIKIKA